MKAVIPFIDVSDPGLDDLFLAICQKEGRRRDDEMRHVSLADLEARYNGPEVGALRRAINAQTLAKMRLGGQLLDYGAGGSFWKDTYWPLFSNVTAAEVSLVNLADVAAHYPDVELWFTRNGGIKSDKKFDVVLSSSVVGYIHPRQAEEHIKSCFKLLKPGGQLIMTRVRAYRLTDALRRNRLIERSPGSFEYGYRKKDLKWLLQEAGFSDIEYCPQACFLPSCWREYQWLARVAPNLSVIYAPRLLPFMKLHHFFVAKRPAESSFS
jgi:SAM-dependent methyltransferase